MKISNYISPSINNFKRTEMKDKSLSQTVTSDVSEQKRSEQKVYSKNLSALGVNFKAKSDDDKTLDELNDEYNWYVNHDKTRPLDAFLKIKTNQKGMNDLFCDILKDNKRSFKLIHDIAGRAREGNDNYKTLKTLLGQNSPNLLFFMPQNPYIKAFESYMDERYENASSIDELIKLRPDWKESVLIDKYKKLTGNTDLKIGKLPEDFNDNKFETICEYLQEHMQISNYKQYKNIEPLTLNGKTYNFEYFTEGKTDKNVFGIYVDDKKYVLKMADKSKKSLNAPFSLGVLAMIDGYLTMNNCRNIAPLYYYDHDKNASLYQYQEHNAIHQKLNDLNEINHFMPDFKALGMCYNDTIGTDNYFLSDKNCEDNKIGYGHTLPQKELISVDNDHVTYSQPFMLMLTKYNISLPNAMQHVF